MVQNKALIYKSVPEGVPVPGKDLVVEARDFDLNQPAPPGGIITKNLYASFDPYMRGKMRDPSKKSYTPAFELGAPIQTAVISQVLKSDNPNYKEGDLVKGYPPIEEYTVIPKEYCEKAASKLENPYNLDLPLFIGALGMPGLTAYSSFYDIGKPKKGETIFVSAASGAVGQIVGQLAKHEGMTVIGSVGSDAKLEFILKELNFDAGFNYKKEKPVQALQRLAPNGIDIYYENVGGEILEAAIETLNDFGRIIACGMISQYNLTEDQRSGPKNIFKVVSKRLTMRGFIVSDPNMGPVYAKEHQERMQKWLAEGSFKAKTSITDGIDKGPEGFVGMLKGENFGKAVLKIADPSK
jgi:NADPH-dependent curcumin reductase CurA